MATTGLQQKLIEYGIRPLRSGKVRDLYAWNDELWIVASDRISAFDVIMPDLIPDKGRLLTQISRFWFERLSSIIPNHVISYDLPQGMDLPEFSGRLVRSKKSEVIPMECVARGYVSGSGWKEYKASGTVGGFKISSGLSESAELPSILFTPATKAEEGHDENLTEAGARAHVGDALYERLRDVTVSLYKEARDYARSRGIIIADTKFEFGWYQGELILIDEALTPDSSRFWPLESYAPGRGQPSFDKQFLRDYLETLDWNKQAPGPRLPKEIIEQTLAKYREALDKLTR